MSPIDDKTVQLADLLLPIAVSEIPKLVKFFMSLGTPQGAATAAQIVAATEHMEGVDAIVKDRARRAMLEAGFATDPGNGVGS
jgi:hypothetical protein